MKLSGLNSINNLGQALCEGLLRLREFMDESMGSYTLESATTRRRFNEHVAKLGMHKNDNCSVDYRYSNASTTYVPTGVHAAKERG
ncbi:hypothetical protein PSEUDO8Z_60224 [Pseudomonas sp. 8Z]|nr:hypothetical protein PSEUDO8Z_60224 [Pseudomonas sp. 8Z]